MVEMSNRNCTHAPMYALLHKLWCTVARPFGAVIAAYGITRREARVGVAGEDISSPSLFSAVVYDGVALLLSISPGCFAASFYSKTTTTLHLYTIIRRSWVSFETVAQAADDELLGLSLTPGAGFGV